MKPNNRDYLLRKIESFKSRQDMLDAQYRVSTAKYNLEVEYINKEIHSLERQLKECVE